ncbi:MAG: response regulator [Polyangiaceae bacterium]
MTEQRIVIVGQRGMALARDLLALGHVVQHVPSYRRLCTGLPSGEWEACVLVVDQLTAHDANLIRVARQAQPLMAVLLLTDDTSAALPLARLTGADDVLVASHARSAARRIAESVSRRRARYPSPTPVPPPATELTTARVYDAIAERHAAQLTERVTHEIDNPATYVTANLTAVNESLGKLAWELRHQPELSNRLDELDQMIRESLSGMARIRTITRDLRTAVRLARAEDPERGSGPKSAPPLGGGATERPSPSTSQTLQRVVAPDPARAAHTAVGRLRLLLIDDEPLVLRALRRMLSEHAVVIANGGNEALEKLAGRADYDLIFCDLMMPEMDGTEVHDAIKRRFPQLLARFVFFTGGALTSRTRAFIEQSTQPLVHKPMTRATFSAISRRVLAQGGGRSARAEG